LHDVEGLGEGLVEVRIGAAARPGHVPLEQAILAVGGRARRGKHDVRTGRVRHRRHLAAWTVTRADLTDVFAVRHCQILPWACPMTEHQAYSERPGRRFFSRLRDPPRSSSRTPL